MMVMMVMMVMMIVRVIVNRTGIVFISMMIC